MNAIRAAAALLLAAAGLLTAGVSNPFAAHATPAVIHSIWLPACGTSLDSTWSQAAAGDTVSMGGCAYAFSTFNPSAKGTAPVVFQGQAGTTVNGIQIAGAQHIVFNSIRSLDWATAWAENKSGGGTLAGDLTFNNVTAPNILFRDVQGLTWNGGQIGPDVDASPTIGAYPGLAPSRNVTLANVHVTGITRSKPGVHVECLFIQDVENFTLDHATVDHCDVYGFSIGGLYGGTKNFLVSNTYFAAATGGGSYTGQLVDGDRSELNTPPSTGHFENNTFEQGIYNPTTIGPQTSPPQNSPLVGCGNVKLGSFGAWPADPAWTAACSGGGTTTTTATTTTQTTTTTPTTTTAPSCAAPLLTATLPTDQTITLTWPKVAGATGYRLYKAGTQTSTAGKSATSAKFGSLAYGDTTLAVQTVCGTSSSVKAQLTTSETRTAH